MWELGIKKVAVSTPYVIPCEKHFKYLIAWSLIYNIPSLPFSVSPLPGSLNPYASY